VKSSVQVGSPIEDTEDSEIQDDDILNHLSNKRKRTDSSENFCRAEQTAKSSSLLKPVPAISTKELQRLGSLFPKCKIEELPPFPTERIKKRVTVNLHDIALEIISAYSSNVKPEKVLGDHPLALRAVHTIALGLSENLRGCA